MMYSNLKGVEYESNFWGNDKMGSIKSSKDGITSLIYSMLLKIGPAVFETQMQMLENPAEICILIFPEDSSTSS